MYTHPSFHRLREKVARRKKQRIQLLLTEIMMLRDRDFTVETLALRTGLKPHVINKLLPYVELNGIRLAEDADGVMWYVGGQRASTTKTDYKFLPFMAHILYEADKRPVEQTPSVLPVVEYKRRDLLTMMMEL